jgi:hypothetical protein
VPLVGDVLERGAPGFETLNDVCSPWNVAISRSSVNGALPALPFTPTYDFENFSSTFEDPFSYSAIARPYEVAPDPENLNEESSPTELDNKLLGFSAPILKATVVGENGQYSDVGMTAELYGMFFVAEDVFGGENNTGRPLELTCYRRNLWQCSGQITLPRMVPQVINEQGRNVPIFELAASITAVESIEGKATEIISIPWKSANPTAGEEAKVAGAPPNVPLDLTTGQEVDATRVSLPVSWKRLQFKHATANNGRRKGLQQHYVVQINLLGKMKNGEYLKIAEIQSGPVIVRGRSPRNFDSRKDVPLTGAASGEKKLERRSTSTDANTAAAAGTNTGDLKSERDHLPHSLQRYHSLGSVQQQAGVDWGTPQPFAAQTQQHPAKKMAVSPSITRPPVPSWSKDSSGSLKAGIPQSSKTSQRQGSTISSVPINLSLSEDERSPNISSPDHQSPQFAKTVAATGQNPSQSPLETADMLYEYFPLSLDDW